MIYIKNDGKEGTNAKVKGMQPEILLAIIIADQLMGKMYERNLTLTSITDGHEDKPKSLHNPGYAFDMRTWSMNGAEKAKFGKELSQLLGDEYDIVVEGNHIHVEFDPPKEIVLLTATERKIEEEALKEIHEEIHKDIHEGKLHRDMQYSANLESKIDKILEWIKFHGEEMKCKFDELEHTCRIEDHHICNFDEAETTQ